jgi:hypothetical protein
MVDYSLYILEKEKEVWVKKLKTIPELKLSKTLADSLAKGVEARIVDLERGIKGVKAIIEGCKHVGVCKK